MPLSGVCFTRKLLLSARAFESAIPGASLRRGLAHDARGRAGHGDLGLRDHRARRISYRTAQYRRCLGLGCQEQRKNTNKENTDETLHKPHLARVTSD